MIRRLLLTAFLGINSAVAVDQPLVTCDFSTINQANALPPYLILDGSGGEPTTINLIEDPESQGNRVARMILQPGQDRQEFVFMRPGGSTSTLMHTINGELWVGFRMRVENLLDTSLSDNSASLFQLGPVSNTLSNAAGSGLFQVQLSRSRGLLSLRTFRSVDGAVTRIAADSTYPNFYDFLPDPQGRWVALTCQLRLRNNADGLLRIWADGKLVADLRGPNALPGDRIQVKWGVYIGIGGSMPDRLSVDYDDIAMAENIAAADDGFRMVSLAEPVSYRSGTSFTRALVPPLGTVTSGLSWATSPLPAGISFNATTKRLVGNPGPSANGQRIAWWLTDRAGVRRYQQVLRLMDLNASPSVPSPVIPAAPIASSDTSESPLLSGTTDVFGIVKIYDNTTLLGNVMASASGAWTWRVTPALAQGNHDLSITVTDATNSTSAFSNVTRITVPDTTAPTRPSAPITSSRTSSTPVLSGTTEANATVKVYDNGTLVGTVSANTSGVWTWTVTPALAQGIHSLKVTATDGANNTSYFSFTTTVNVPDRTPPAIPAAPSASSLTSATPVLSGTTEANARVKIYNETTLLTTVTANASGAWNWTVTPALAQGLSHHFRITATDGANNTSDLSNVTTVTVRDTTPPVTPAAPAASSLTSANPVLSGSTEANATIKIFDGTTLRKTLTASPTGAWSWTVTPSLTVGSHAITVTATDVALNASVASLTTTINVPSGIVADATPPTRPMAPTLSSDTDSTPVVSGTTEARATISLFDNGLLIKTIAANGSGSWSWTVSPAFALGSHALTVIATDGAGNASAVSEAKTVTLSDTTPPATPGTPSVGASTDDTPTLSGTTEANATVTIYDGSTQLHTVIANSIGNWTWTVTPALAQGEHLVTVTATDLASNVSGRSPARTIVVPDITPPATPERPSASSLTSATPTISGTTEANATVKIYDATTLLNSVTANAAGAWSWTVTPALVEGSHSLQVTATDADNNVSAVSSAIIIDLRDTTPPATPTAPVINSASDEITTLSGTTEANATVTIYEGATQLYTVIANSAGDWTWTVAPALTLGVHSFAVTVTDLASNVSGRSLATSITVRDTTAPTKPPAPTASSLSSANPVLSGTTEANAKIKLFVGPTLTATVTAGPTGAWSWTVRPSLSVGSHAITVTATDAANNASAPSLATTITVPPGIVADTTRPTRPSAPTVSSDTSSTPVVSGSTEVGATISLFDNGQLIKTISVNRTGSWSWTVSPAFSSGIHSLTVIATDGAGNASLASVAKTVTVTVSDTMPPATPDAPAVNNASVATPTLSGQTEANATVTVYDGATRLHTVIANSIGFWNWTVTPALAQGEHLVTVTATDLAGNVSWSSPGTRITAPDVTPPDIPPAPAATSRTSATPVLSGTTEANATVKIYDDATLLITVTANGTGAWTWTVSPALAQGIHSLKITAADVSGNVSALSPATTITVRDTTPPTTPPAPTSSSLTSATPVLSGTTEANATVKIYDNTTLLQTVTASATGVWTWTVTPALSQGSHALKITATDTANNTSALSLATTITVPDTTPPTTPAAPTANSLSSANPVLSGTTEANATIKIYAGATLLKTVTASPTGAWTWTVTPSLTVGTHAITVTATDAASNTSASSLATTITVAPGILADTIPPTRPTAPIVSSVTSPTPVVSGITEVGATISLFDNGLLIKTIAVTSSGNWSWTVSPAFALGSHPLTVTATDSAGNTSGVSEANTVTVRDTAPPATPAAPAVNSASDDTPTLSGTTEANATVTIYDGATQLHTLIADSIGNWTWTVTSALDHGVHMLSVTATDGAGNVSAASAATTIEVLDITAPSIPVVTAIANETTGTPTLRGTAEVFATILIYDGGTTLGTTTVNAEGMWSWTVTPALSEGMHQLTVTAQDAASNRSDSSVAITIAVADITPPAIPGAPRVSNGTSPQPTFFGSTESGATITIYDALKPLASITAGSDGTWSFTCATDLSSGQHVITVTAQDDAGNTSGVSPSTIINVADLATGSTKAATPRATGISTATPTLAGTSDPGTSIQIFDGGLPISSATADSTGHWEWTPPTPLTVGTHQLTVVEVDPLGNAGDPSDALVVTVPPPVNSPVADAGGSGGCGGGGTAVMLLGGLLALGSRRKHAGASRPTGVPRGRTW